MSTTMILTPQLVFRVSCACGETDQGGFDNYPAVCAAKQRLIESGANCICGGNAWGIYWRSEWLPDPIATVRQVHPRAFALPPGARCGQWSIIPSANSSPLPYPIAEGATEAAAWLAAAEGVCV
jgi:hypothetical protein